MERNLIEIFKQVCVDKGINKGPEGSGLANANAVWNDRRLAGHPQRAELKTHVEASAIVILKDKGPFYSKGPGWQLL
jgi:hypothetical protein